MAQSKIDSNKLELDLRNILAKNNKILAVLKRVEGMAVPEGKTPLALLAEELEKEGLETKEVLGETAKV